MLRELVDCHVFFVEKFLEATGMLVHTMAVEDPHTKDRSATEISQINTQELSIRRWQTHAAAVSIDLPRNPNCPFAKITISGINDKKQGLFIFRAITERAADLGW
jgi:hypothetical protein